MNTWSGSMKCKGQAWIVVNAHVLFSTMKLNGCLVLVLLDWRSFGCNEFLNTCSVSILPSVRNIISCLFTFKGLVYSTFIARIFITHHVSNLIRIIESCPNVNSSSGGGGHNPMDQIWGQLPLGVSMALMLMNSCIQCLNDFRASIKNYRNTNCTVCMGL